MEKKTILTNLVQIHAIEKLRSDNAFVPAEGSSIVEYTISGVTVSAHSSYYRHLLTGNVVHIRASEHGTSLERWLRNNPQNALQNVSIVFSDVAPTAGTNVSRNTVSFFIVEQYYYILRSITNADVDKILEKVKAIQSTDDAEKVFIDPFKNNPKKRAGVQILQPHKDNIPIPIPQTGVNQRQLDIANGIIKLSESQLRQIIRESLIRTLYN